MGRRLRCILVAAAGTEDPTSNQEDQAFAEVVRAECEREARGGNPGPYLEKREDERGAREHACGYDLRAVEIWAQDLWEESVISEACHLRADLCQNDARVGGRSSCEEAGLLCHSEPSLG